MKVSDLVQIGAKRLAHVEWHITNFCNYKCSYCYPLLNGGSNLGPDLDLALRVVDSAVASSKLPVWFSLTGGEPTTWKPLVDFLKATKDKLQFVIIITNGSRSTNWFENELFPALSGWLTMSFHAEFADPDKFLANAMAAHAAQKLQKIHVPMAPNNWDTCVQLYEACAANGLPVIAKPVFEDFGVKNGVVDIHQLVEYTEAQTAWLREKAEAATNVKFTLARFVDGSTKRISPHELLVEGAPDFRGWKCAAGHTRLLIGPQGHVLPGVCRVTAPFGNIYTDGPQVVKFNDDLLTCTKKSCHCPVEVSLYKERP